MSYGSEQTRRRILECARQEFMEHGYQNANMRRISRAAQATTGALYNHFANKAVLFDALVQAPAEEMLAQFEEIHRQAAQVLSTLRHKSIQDKAYDGTDWMLAFMFQHLDAFRLIFCRSEGTRWSTYLERLIEVEEQAYRIYCNTLGTEDTAVDDFFLHVTATSGFQYLVEIISHNLPYPQAVAVMNHVKRYSMAGWNEILGFRP